MTTLHSSLSLVCKRWLSSAPAILALALAMTACGPADERPPPPTGTGTGTEVGASDIKEDIVDSDNNVPTRQYCEEGDARECRIKLPKQGSVQGCIDGVRYCENGVWGRCVVD